MIKKREMQANQGIYVIHSQEALNRYTPDARLILQEYLPGKSYAVEVFVTKKGEVKAIVPVEMLPGQSGFAEMSRIVRDDTLESLARTVVRMLGIRFTSTVLFTQDNEGKPTLVGVWPSFSASTSLAVAAGVNTPLLCLKTLRDRAIEEEECQYLEMAMARFPDEEFLPLSALEKMEGMANEIHAIQHVESVAG